MRDFSKWHFPACLNCINRVLVQSYPIQWSCFCPRSQSYLISVPCMSPGWKFEFRVKAFCSDVTRNTSQLAKGWSLLTSCTDKWNQKNTFGVGLSREVSRLRGKRRGGRGRGRGRQRRRRGRTQTSGQHVFSSQRSRGKTGWIRTHRCACDQSTNVGTVAWML